MSFGVSSYLNASHLHGNHNHSHTPDRPEQWWKISLRKGALSAGALKIPREVLGTRSKASPQEVQAYTIWSPKFCRNGWLS